jgi:hypothetical protein
MSESQETAQETEVQASEEIAKETETQEVKAEAAVEEQKVEAKTEEADKASEDKKADSEEKKPEEDKKFAQKFAALSRREKAIKEREKKLEQRLADLEAKSKPQAEAPKEPLELRLKKNPFETLKELGLDYGALTQIALNEGKLTPELQMQVMRQELEGQYKSEIDQLRQRLDGREKQEEEAKQAKQTQDFLAEIKQHISSNTTDYDLLSFEGEDGVDVVTDVIVQHYNTTGEVMTIKEAADLVEEQLLEEAKIRLAKSKKVQGLITQPKPTAKAAPTEQKTEKRASVTLSNEQAQVASTKKTQALSREEAIAEASKLIRYSE